MPRCVRSQRKCANLVRLVTTSLFIGYYTGAAILLRAAFESLAYVHLFDDDPDEIKLWLKVELHPSLDPGQREELRRSQRDRAKDSFVRRAPSEKRERDLIKFLWDRCSHDIHSPVVGLAQWFGLDFRDFLPDKFWVALEKAGDDWGFALDLLSWRAVDKQEVWLGLMGRHDAVLWGVATQTLA